MGNNIVLKLSKYGTNIFLPHWKFYKDWNAKSLAMKTTLVSEIYNPSLHYNILPSEHGKCFVGSTLIACVVAKSLKLSRAKEGVHCHLAVDRSHLQTFPQLVMFSAAAVFPGCISGFCGWHSCFKTTRSTCLHTCPSSLDQVSINQVVGSYPYQTAHQNTHYSFPRYK